MLNGRFTTAVTLAKVPFVGYSLRISFTTAHPASPEAPYFYSVSLVIQGDKD